LVGDVFEVLSRQGSTDLEWSRFVIAELINAVRYLHANGIIHGDIKVPSSALRAHDLAHTATVANTDVLVLLRAACHSPRI
jgi:serine/threonine protein kinase